MAKFADFRRRRARHRRRRRDWPGRSTSARARSSPRGDVVQRVQRLVPARRPRRRNRDGAETGPRFGRDRSQAFRCRVFRPSRSPLSRTRPCPPPGRSTAASDTSSIPGCGWTRRSNIASAASFARPTPSTIPRRPALGPFRSADRLRGGVSSIVALVNGYVDLGNYWGATPFVGAGIGVADNALSGVSDQGFAIAGSGAIVPVGGFFSNASRTSFAWALTAGFDFDLAPNLKLEASYRYLNLGSIAVGGLHCVPGAQACLGGAGVAASSRNALASNDLRVGLIWLIGEPQPAPRPVVARD